MPKVSSHDKNPPTNKKPVIAPPTPDSKAKKKKKAGEVDLEVKV